MMKKILSMFALVAALGLGFTANTFAEDAAPAADAAAVVAAPEAAPAAVAPVATTEAAAPAAAPAVPNKGDTAWMLISTVLVTLMVIPGLALFYGGLVRQKNMLAICTHANFHDFLSHGRVMGYLWLQRSIHRRQSILWWFR